MEQLGLRMDKNALQSKVNHPLVKKLYGKCAPDFTHPDKSLCGGVVDMHYFDLDLGPMTLVLKLDLDMVVTYLHAKY